MLSRNLVTCREDFYEEARKPGTIGKNSWFPGFLMELFLVAAWPRCVFVVQKIVPPPAILLFQPEKDSAVGRAVGDHAVIAGQHGEIGDRRPVWRGDIGGGLKLVIGRPGRPANHIVSSRPRQAYDRRNTAGTYDRRARAGHALEGEINRIIPPVGVGVRAAHLFSPNEITVSPKAKV